MRKFIILLFGLGLFLGWGIPVRAQGQDRAEADLYPADASAFPAISSFLDVFDSSGRFVSGLKPEQVTVLEDDQPLQLNALTESVVPMQLAVAISPGPVMDIHDKAGVGRFDVIYKTLSTWAKALPADVPDDMSLVSINGPLLAHGSARDWQVSLDSFQPDFKATSPNLQSLQVALEMVTVAPPRVGMKRAILFITTHMDDADITTQLQPLVERAIQNRVRVFVWFVDTEPYAATTSAAAFSALALETGGAYFSDIGLGAPYPDPETYFAPLRRIYSLQYDSVVKTGGAHTLSVDVRGQAGDIKSADQSFNVDLQPPNPIFVSPTLQIERRPPTDDPYNEKVLLPEVQKIDVLVEFPDGHKRALVRTTLIVDGKIVGENKAEPFGAFTWDLSGYKTSGEHKLVVEAVDSLNLSKLSTDLPVTVTVVEAPHGLSAVFGRYRQQITFGAVGLAGLVLLGILFMGRFRLSFLRRRFEKQSQADPLTQPVPVVVERPVEKSNGKEPAVKRVRLVPGNGNTPPAEAPARLQRLISDPLAAPGETFKTAPVAPIPLAEKEISFGTDPVQSVYVLDDPSLAPRHARILQTDNGGFLVTDAGTIAGTWVNFEPVGKEGHTLQHGDVVHFGQLIYRFELKDPPLPAEPTIVRENA